MNRSAAERMEIVSASGTSKWSLNSPMGCVFGFHTLEDCLYRRPVLISFLLRLD